MRYKKMHCILSVFVLLLALCCGVSLSIGAENQESQPVATEENCPITLEEPGIDCHIKGNYFLGYRWISQKDALKAAEYIYPHSSATFGLDFVACPLPFRYHVNSEFLSSYDFYTDAGFAYKDLVLFRDILVGAHHNLEHFNYHLSTESPVIHTDNNEGDKYYTDFTSNLVTLRLKQPDFPLHAFLTHRYVDQEGKLQQRFMTGTVGSPNKISESRDFTWNSSALKLGANSHLGPVELEYAYDQAKFNPGPNNILYDGTDPHHVVPETESSAHSLKFHSSYTGGIVTAATLSNLYEKNNYSLTESTTWKGAFDFTWIPDPLVGIFFKYRHRNVNMDTPDVVTLVGPVRDGISYGKDIFSLSTRYRPLNYLSLLATYEFSHLERKDVAEWDILPGQTNIHTINFTTHVKPLDRVKVTGSYEVKIYDQPAYNNTPDNSNKLRLTTTYTPTPWLNVYLEYLLAMTERNALSYIINDPSLSVLEFGERDGRRDQFLASLTTALSPKLSMTTSWFYQRWDVQQDLVYGKWNNAGTAGTWPYTDFGVPYTDASNSFSLSFHYLPTEDITCVAGATYTIAKGDAGYTDVVGGAPFSLSSFSSLKTSETLFSLGITKRLSKEWEVGINSSIGIYNDRAYDLSDGNVVTSICNLKRYF